jgi:hypothetical protein
MWRYGSLRKGRDLFFVISQDGSVLRQMRPERQFND